MNPKAVHIWEYLRDASMNMLRDNYVDKCYEMNLPFFQNEFKIKPNHHTFQEINLDNNIRILSKEEGYYLTFLKERIHLFLLMSKLF